MGVFDERRDEQRLERGFQAAVLAGGAGLVGTFYLWFGGTAGPIAVAGLMLLCAAALGLGFRLREGSVRAANAIVGVVAVGLVIAVVVRPLTFDLLALLVLFLLLRARQAALSMEARGAAAPVRR